MTTPTVPVTVTIEANGVPIEGVTVRAQMDGNEVYEGIVVARMATAITDASGNAVLNLFPNAPAPTGLGTQGTTYRIWAAVPGGHNVSYFCRVPNEACRLENIIVSDYVGALSDAQLAVLQAQQTLSGVTDSMPDIHAALALATYAGPTAPASPVNGKPWLNTTTGKRYTWYEDGSSGQWVEDGGFVFVVDSESMATLAASNGATKVGTSTGTVQSDLTARPTSSVLAASGGAASVGTIASGTGAVARTVQDKQRDFVSVKDFGAKGDGTTDDLAALNAAVSAIFAAGGGKLLIPKGYFRITGTWNIGSPEFSDYSFIVSRTAALTDADFTAHRISANVTANRLLPAIEIVFDDGAFIVADFTVATPTPVIGLNRSFGYDGNDGKIINPSVISKTMMVAGKYNFDAVTTTPSNNLIGIFTQAGTKVIEKPFVGGCSYGIVSANAYWTSIRDPRVDWASGDCLNMAGANAATVENLVMWDSNRGLVFDGAASRVAGIHAEAVAQEMTIFSAECCEFGPAYLEDAGTADGTGTYAVTLGTTANAQQIISSMLKGIRVGSARPNKGAFRLWALSNATLAACRAYSKTITSDTNSTGSLDNCDFSTTVQLAKFSADRAWPAMSAPGTAYIVYGPWMFAISGVAPGSIAAGTVTNYDYTMPTSMNSFNSLAAAVTTTSGGNDLIKLSTTLINTTPKKIRIRLANTTAAAIDPGTMNLSLVVFAGV